MNLPIKAPFLSLNQRFAAVSAIILLILLCQNSAFGQSITVENCPFCRFETPTSPDKSDEFSKIEAAKYPRGIVHSVLKKHKVKRLVVHECNAREKYQLNEKGQLTEWVSHNRGIPDEREVYYYSEAGAIARVDYFETSFRKMEDSKAPERFYYSELDDSTLQMQVFLGLKPSRTLTVSQNDGGAWIRKEKILRNRHAELSTLEAGQPEIPVELGNGDYWTRIKQWRDHAGRVTFEAEKINGGVRYRRYTFLPDKIIEEYLTEENLKIVSVDSTIYQLNDSGCLVSKTRKSFDYPHLVDETIIAYSDRKITSSEYRRGKLWRKEEYILRRDGLLKKYILTDIDWRPEKTTLRQRYRFRYRFY